MENKNKFWKGVLVGVLASAFGCLLVVGLSTGIYLWWNTAMSGNAGNLTVSGGKESGAEKKRDNRAMEAKLDVLQQVVDKYFLYDADPELMEQGIYKGFLAALGDPYSQYYTEEEYKGMLESTEGVYCGIGVQVSQNLQTGIMTVTRVFKNSPGYEGGLLPGDMIAKVDGEDVAGQQLEDVVSQKIKGEEGTEVTLTVYRPSAEDYLDITMTRKIVEAGTVEYEMMDGNVGYVEVWQFDTVTAAQFEEAIDDLESQGMEKLVIDLRDNPGGVLDGSVKMLAYLLPDGMLVSTKAKDGSGTAYRSDGGKLLYEVFADGKTVSSKEVEEDDHQLDIPTAILVNGQSASASEVFTGAMKDYGRATVVGTTTFGKGIVQNLIPLTDGTAVKLTVSNYYTPNGHNIHKKGIEPDVEVEMDSGVNVYQLEIPKEEDNQLQAAIEALQ